MTILPETVVIVSSSIVLLLLVVLLVGIAKSLGEPILDSFRPQVEPAIKNVLDMADS